MIERPNYYAILSAEVRYDNRLKPNVKLLYAEITALCNMNKECEMHMIIKHLDESSETNIGNNNNKYL